MVDRLKTKYFHKWAKKADLNNADLLRACDDLESGLFAANLGGSVFKIRVARESQGKSSGYRTILAYSKNRRVVFLYGFAKNERDNISDKELTAFKKLSKDYLALDSSQLAHAIKIGILVTMEAKDARCS